ncbi:hypothetical protein IIA28_16725, partial [candidate division KSB1 bacterium]|nr:hypothetical protein [candidate division KSB1 bacterium]
EMMKEIRSALLTITPAETETENHIQQGSSEVVLSDIETKILHIAMEFESQRMRGDTVEVFAGQLSLSITNTKYYLQRLVDDEYLYDLVAIGSPTRYRLSTKGREYLVENDLI